MRLSKIQEMTIRSKVTDFFGKESRVWLFGSRVDDSKRGGDVDLYVEPEKEMPLMTVLKCKIDLEENLDLHVDLIVRETGKQNPIYTIAKSQGLLL